MADTIPAGIDPVGVRNIIGNQINPSTSEDVAGLLSQNLNIAGLAIPKSDALYASYPSPTQEIYTYKLAGVTVLTVTINYTDSSKTEFIDLVQS